MNVNHEAAELLERTADGFESGRYYWTQGAYGRKVFGNQAFCSIGALAYESGHTMKVNTYTTGLEWRSPALDKAIEALALKIKPDTATVGWFPDEDLVISWNDDRFMGRTKNEVIEAMKRAAKDLHNEGGDA